MRADRTRARATRSRCSLRGPTWTMGDDFASKQVSKLCTSPTASTSSSSYPDLHTHKGFNSAPHPQPQPPPLHTQTYIHTGFNSAPHSQPPPPPLHNQTCTHTKASTLHLTHSLHLLLFIPRQAHTQKRLQLCTSPTVTHRHRSERYVSSKHLVDATFTGFQYKYTSTIECYRYHFL